MSICAFQRPGRHAEKFAGHHHVGSRLHQPSRRGVAQDMRRDVAAEFSSDGNFLHGSVNANNRSVAPLDDVALSAVAPAAQMRQ